MVSNGRQINIKLVLSVTVTGKIEGWEFGTEEQKTLYSYGFHWCFNGSMEIVDISSFVSQKDACSFLGNPVMTWKTKKMSQTNCIWISYNDSDKLPIVYHTNAWHAKKTSKYIISRRLNHQNLVNSKKNSFIMLLWSWNNNVIPSAFVQHKNPSY